MKIFTHKKINFRYATRVQIKGQRYYKTPNGMIYPSVSSVTSYEAKDGIQEWKDRIGEENANIIVEKASTRGTEIHALCENYLNNLEVIPETDNEVNWLKIRPILDNIDNIYGVELPLYSDSLEVAGTTDCIAEYNGVLSVIDFKTARKLKRREWIIGYIRQCVMYAVSFMELTGKYVSQLVIIIAVDDHEPQIFIEKVEDWIDSTITCRNAYRNINK